MPTALALDRALAQRMRAAGEGSECLGRYELLGRLGAGGMAEVFVARAGDVTGMETLFAVKRILPDLAEDDRFLRLFRREARISLRLQHRAIARVVEVGHADDHWFLAMELVVGESLSSIMRMERELAQPADPLVVAWVGAEIASALHHAHGSTDADETLGIIHRDVSPQNILLSFEGAAKLIDFGVARCSVSSVATRAGTVMGKLAYASPEQLRARRVDGRSDLFSLAVVLYEWLLGERLFARDTDEETIRAVESGRVPPLPRTPALARVLSRAMARDPRERYPDGESFADALLSAARSPGVAGERKLRAHLEALMPEQKKRWMALVRGARNVPSAAGAPAGEATPAAHARTLPLAQTVISAGDDSRDVAEISAPGSPSREAAKPVAKAGRPLLTRRSLRTAALVGALGSVAFVFLAARLGRSTPRPSEGPAVALSTEPSTPAPEEDAPTSRRTASPRTVSPPTSPLGRTPPAPSVAGSPRHRSKSARRAVATPKTQARSSAARERWPGPSPMLDELEPSPYHSTR